MIWIEVYSLTKTNTMIPQLREEHLAATKCIILFVTIVALLTFELPRVARIRTRKEETWSTIFLTICALITLICIFVN